jgi:hypothetical protein
MLRIFFLLSSLTAASAYTPLWSAGAKAASLSVEKSETISRRNLLASAAAFGASSLLIDPLRVNADDSSSGLVSYEDADYKFKMMVPSDWDKTIQSLPDGRKIVLYIKPNSEQKTLLFFAYTPVRGDFTSLGSFGSVDEVAQTTILPKSELAGVDGVESKMLSAESKKQSYFFDYMSKVPGQPNVSTAIPFSSKCLSFYFDPT